MDSNAILILNLLFYFAAFYFFQRRSAGFRFGSVVLFVYFFVSVISLFLFDSEFSNFNDLSLLPFVYLFVVFLIFVYPLLNLREKKFSDIFIYDSRCLDFLSILLITLTLLNFFGEIQLLSLSSLFDYNMILNSYDQSHEELELMTSESSVLRMLYVVIRDFSFPLLIYNILLKKKKMIYGILFSIILGILLSLSNSSRNGLVSLVVSLPYLYIILKYRLGEKLKKKLLFILAVFVIFIGFIFFIITYARFGQESNDKLFYSLENYTEQSMLVFNNYRMDANGITYGDRTAPLIRKLLGLKTSTNYYERRFVYSKMLVNDSYFITFIGDFTLDYGPMFAVIILSIFSFLFFRCLKIYNKYSLSHIFILYLYYNWCVRGFTLWTYSEKLGNLSLVMFFVIFCLLRYKEKYFYGTKQR